MKDSDVAEYVNHLRELTDEELLVEHEYCLDTAIHAIKNSTNKEEFWGHRHGICDAVLEERGMKP